MARLDIVAALDAQPFGTALFLLVVAAGVAALYCAVFNRSLLGIASRVFTKRTAIIIVLVFLFTWAFQVIKTLALR
jgi:hypothetical protein